MKKVFSLLLCLAMVLSVTTACQKEEEHIHTFDSAWLYDEAEHWHAATCEHTDEVSEKGAHEDADGNDICDICGYIADHTHTYADVWTKGTETHYHASICGHNVKQDEAAHADTNNDGLCDVCEYDYGHTHTYDEVWTAADENGHWHAANCGHDVDGIDKEAHVDENNDGDCDVCGYNGGHQHTYADTWSTDDDEHWKEVTCGHSVSAGEKGVHVDADGDSACDVCGHIPEHFHTFEDTLSSNAEGHYYKSTCGHDVKKDMTAHDDGNDDGVCDTCAYVIFHRYNVTVDAPEYVTVTAPDGTVTNTFLVKEGTEVTFTLTVPKYAEVKGINGASFVGDPVEDGDSHVYTVKVANLTADSTVTLSVNKLTAVEILAEVATALPITQQFYNDMSIMLTVPSAGDYAVYSFDNDKITFGTEEGTSRYYTFHTDAAGEVTVLARHFAWSIPESGELAFTYVVYKLDDPFKLPTLTGEGYTMPTNVPVNLEFTVPTPGIWSLSSSVTGIAWDDYITSTHTFITTEANQTVTVELKYQLLGYSTFTFDWSLTTYETIGVNEGETSLTIPYGDYKGISFTATSDGTYHFDLGHNEAYFYEWNNAYSYMSSLGNEFNLTMSKGDTVTYYVAMAPYGDTRADVDDVLTVENLGYFPPYENGGYTALTGVQNAHENGYSEGDFIFSVPENAQISFDGGKTWHSSVMVTMAAYETVTYHVQTTDGSTEVTVQVSRVAYEFTLGMGTQTQTMVPGKDYTVYLTGFTSEEWYKSFILSWTDANITVVYNGKTLVSGAQTDQYTGYYAISIVYNGAAEAEIEFTLAEVKQETDPDDDTNTDTDDTDTPVVPADTTLELGANSVHVTVSNYYCEPVKVTFTAPATGTYTLSAADGETNADVGIEDEYGMEWFDPPYEFFVQEGETVTFLVATTDIMNLTEDDIDLVITLND